MSFGMRRVKLSGVFLLVGLTLGGGASAAPAMAPDKGLVEAIGGPVRSDANKARDVYRHPLETLTFFGLQANMVVVEIAPGGGLVHRDSGALSPSKRQVLRRGR